MSTKRLTFPTFLLICFLRTSFAENPATIYTYDLDGSSFADRVLMASVSGIVARESPEVHLAYRSSSSFTDPEFWLEQHVASNPNTNVVWQNDPKWFIDQYKTQFNGYVLYDRDSINQATSVAGALGALMVDANQLSGSIGTALKNAEIRQVADARGKTSDWAYDTYRDSYNRDFIYRQQPRFAHHLRSHAIKNAGFMFDETAATRDRYLAGQNDHSAVVGWGYRNSESEFFQSASDHNLTAIPADHLQSAASLSGWKVDAPKQAHVAPNTPTKEDAHYVAFVMSDGDNVQWLSGEFGRNPRWFGSPKRGNFPMTFDMTPALADFNPTALAYFYEQAANDAEKTYFVNSGGYGINYPSRLSDVDGFVDRTVEAMQTADQRVISILDPSYDKAKLNALAERPEITGVMFKTNANAYAGNQGEVYWHEGTPVASVRHTLWDGFDTPNELIATLNSSPREPQSNVASYSIVNVHPWSVSREDGGQGDPMSNVDYIVSNLQPHVEVVTLDEFFHHLTQNQASLGAATVTSVNNLIANGDFETVSPANRTRPNDWFSSGGQSTSLVNADDSAAGQYSAAINRANADWRSIEFNAEAGSRFTFAFDFKLHDVAKADGFRADARFFDNSQGSGGKFAGETTKLVLASDYEADRWHTVLLNGSVPDDAKVGDVPFSTFFSSLSGGQVLIDNVRLFDGVVELGDCSLDGAISNDDLLCMSTINERDAILNAVGLLPGDLDGDGIVGFTDFLTLSLNFGADATSYFDGNIDLQNGVGFTDFLVLSQNFGRSFAVEAAAASSDISVMSVPEPSGSLLLLGCVIAWVYPTRYAPQSEVLYTSQKRHIAFLGCQDGPMETLTTTEMSSRTF